MKCFSRLAFCTIVLSICCCSAAEPGNWSQWRGENRDGRVIDGDLPEKLDGRLRLMWERPHGPSYSGPVVRNGLLYTTETVDKKSERVTAYQVDTGQVVWTTEWPGAMSVPFFAAANGDWIRSTPACSDSALLVVGMRDVLVCLDPKSGEQKWRVDFVTDFGSPLPMFGASCSPLIDGDAAYLQTAGATVCLSLADGSLRWKCLAETDDGQSSGAFSSPVIATLAGTRQLLVQTRQELCGVDLQTGAVLWREPIEAYRGMNILTPLVVGDSVFTSAHSGRAQLFRISQQNGSWEVTERWAQKQQAYMSSPVSVAGKIFMHLRNERFACLDVETGEELFTSKPVGKYASFVAHGERILALTNRGELMLLDASSDSYQVIDQMQVATDSWAHVALAGNRIVVRDLSRLKVYGF